MKTAAVALLAAVIGAVLVLGVGKGGGWLDGTSTTRTVVVREPGLDSSTPIVVAKPVPGGFQPARIYRQRADGVVTIYSFFDPSASSDARAAQGSGFVVSRDGVVLTSAHVITDAGESAGRIRPAKEVYVQFADGDRVPARIVGFDPFDDVGVLRVDPRSHAVHPVPLGDSSRVAVGEPVAAIGSPFDNQSSLSTGVVSATRRSIDSLTSEYSLVDAIQTDAPINHGNSGGPLFNAAGEVIGINAQIRSDAGRGFEGVGFAVPINSARRSLRQLLRTGRVAYAYVGISAEDLTPGVARRLGYPVARGALIDKVERGAAGDRAGLRAGDREVALDGRIVRAGGDVIVAIDGVPVRSSSDVIRIVSGRLYPGETARFTIVRDGKRLTIPVVLTERSR